MNNNATYANAMTALEQFCPRAGQHYTRLRNTDFGPTAHTNVSRLSPWLRHRCLLEDEVLSAVLAEHSPKEAMAYIQEVFWRGYFRGHLAHKPDIWSGYIASRDTAFAQVATDPSTQAQLNNAKNGTTGIACFDTWAHELVDTGYLHNHARMWFASIWIFTLKLPWVLGADFFLQHLVDGDPASNTCSWRWVAGLHTVGKTYLAESNNIATYTDNRFAHTGGLASDALPLTEPPLPAAVAPTFEPPTALPSDCRVGLLVVESDCQPESLTLPAPPCNVLTLTDPCRRSISPLAERPAHFTKAALLDANHRASEAFGVTTTQTDNPDWHQALTDWVKNSEIEVIAVATPPVGWVHDRLQPALRVLEDNGTCVARITRPHDRAVWPHSGKGFFRVKKQIPALLGQLGIPQQP